MADQKAHIWDQLVEHVRERNNMGEFGVSKSSVILQALEEYFSRYYADVKDHTPMQEPDLPEGVAAVIGGYEYSAEDLEVRQRVLNRGTLGPSPDAPPVRSEARGEVD